MTIPASLQEIAVLYPVEPSAVVSFLLKGHLYVLKVQYDKSVGFRGSLIHMTDNPKSCKHLGIKINQMIAKGTLVVPKSISPDLEGFSLQDDKFVLNPEYLNMNLKDAERPTCTVMFLGSCAIITAITEEDRVTCRIARRIAE